MHQAWAFLGAIVGAGTGFVLTFMGVRGYSSVGLLAGLLLALSSVTYVGAAVTEGRFRSVWLGWLVGCNSAANASLVALMVRSIGPDGLALALGSAAGLLSILSCVPAITRQPRFQRLLAWGVWLLPTAWPVQALGLLLFALNLLGHSVAYPPFSISFWRVNGIRPDYRTGTLFVWGGWISNLNAFHTAFNLGSLTFVHSQSPSWFEEHETGHTLNLGAFGALFHLIGAIDEVLLHQGASSLAERVAESHHQATTHANVVPMWVSREGPGRPPTQRV